MELLLWQQICTVVEETILLQFLPSIYITILAPTPIYHVLLQFQNSNFSFCNLYLSPRLFLISCLISLMPQCSPRFCCFQYENSKADSLIISWWLSCFKVRWNYLFSASASGLTLPHLECTIPRRTYQTSLTYLEVHGGSIDRTSYWFGTISSFIQHLQSSLPQLQSVEVRGPLLNCWHPY